MVIAVSVAGTGAAAEAERPKELNISHGFSEKVMDGYGAKINADISELGHVFGMGREFHASPILSARPGKKGWLGIAMLIPDQLPKDPGTGEELSAIQVSRIVPQSAAEAAGLFEGDLIVGLDGGVIEREHKKTMFAFAGAISAKAPGSKATLRILRDGVLRDIEATIRPYPRVDSVLKKHPDLAAQRRSKRQSLLEEALAKEGLQDELARTMKDIRNETDKVDSSYIRDDGYHPFRLQEVSYVMNYPLDLPAVSRGITERLQGDFGGERHDLAAVLRMAMGELDMAALPVKRRKDGAPADIAEYVERLVRAIRHAKAEREAVLSVLNPQEMELLFTVAPTLLEKKDGIVKPDDTGGETEEKKEKTRMETRREDAMLLRLFRIVLKLDMARLLNASVSVAQALEPDVLAAMDKGGGKLQRYPASWIVREEGGLTVIDTPAGRVLVGGDRDDVYAEDAALILDFGGNDRYLNHAGGSTPDHPFSVVIDLAGNDSYASSGDFAQGAGLLGGGFLVDLEGDDRYEARSYSQGTGILGVGILADLSGNDRYTSATASQGVGSFGIGVLAEGGGDDVYSGNYFVQGAGYVNGFGAIVEAAGNDSYFAGGKFEDFRAPGKSYQSLSQGFGYGMRPREFVSASGGIGVIAEASGNDTYIADYFAQGASYWFALGILDDRKGHDRYVSGRYSQGAGIHLSAGALLDGEGDDNYLADFGVAQGCGHDYGIGFLLDNGGNDRYTAGTVSQGAGNDSGIGVLSDNGGNDEYYLKMQGQGRGNFDPFRDVGSFGFLFDTGGGEDIYTQGGANNSLNYKTQWGILLDGR